MGFISPESSERTERKRGFYYIILGVFFFSTSPVLVYGAEGVSPLEKTFWRLFIGSIVIGALHFIFERYPRGPKQDKTSIIALEITPEQALNPLTVNKTSSFRQEIRTWWQKPALRFTFYGLVTALHFFFYIASLDYTTAAHSLTVTYTSPIFVTIFALIFLKETISSRKWSGIGLVIVGVGVLSGFDPHYNWRTLEGDLLALGAAICYGIYSIAGRSERTRYPLFQYAALVYGLAALWLLPLTLVSFPQSHYQNSAIISIIALGLGPLALGHTLYNASLRRLPSTYVNIIATQEVTGGVILTAIFSGQALQLASIPGMLIIMGGILIVLL